MVVFEGLVPPADCLQLGENYVLVDLGLGLSRVAHEGLVEGLHCVELGHVLGQSAA